MEYKIQSVDSSEKSQILFFGKSPNDKEEMIKLSRDGFYFKGEKVEDKYQVYERFNEWLKQAEAK